MAKVFVYGTLKRNKSNHWYLIESKYLGEYYTDNNYALYVRGLPYMVKEDKGGGVLGELFEVDEFTLEQLDKLEGHPNFYRREEIWVYDATNGLNVKVYAYIMPNKVDGVKVKSY
jgi:gamma-glutamylaminecyclotransferase